MFLKLSKNKYKISLKNIIKYYYFNKNKEKKYHFHNNFDILIFLLKENQFIKNFYDEIHFFKNILGIEFYLYLFYSDFDQNKTDADMPCLKFSKGFSFDKNLAISKAIGESLERTPFIYYRKKSFKKFSTKEGIKNDYSFLDPEQITIFDKTQRKENENLDFNKNTEFFWQNTKEIYIDKNKIKEKDIYLPAQILYWHYHTKRIGGGETYLRPPTTHGGAGHFLKNDAILACLYEWIARDGFFSFWLKNISPSKIDIESINDPEIKSTIDKIRNSGFDIFLLNVESELANIPNMFCILVNVNNTKCFNKYYFGSGCSIGLKNAILSSIDEAMSLIVWTEKTIDKYMKERIEGDNYLNWFDAERTSFFQTKEGYEQLKFIFDGRIYDYKKLEMNYKNNLNKKDLIFFIINSIKNKLPSFRFFYICSNHKLLKEVGYHSIKSFTTDLLQMYNGVWQFPSHTFNKRFPNNKLLNKYKKIHPFP